MDSLVKLEVGVLFLIGIFMIGKFDAFDVYDVYDRLDRYDSMFLRGDKCFLVFRQLSMTN